MNHCSQSFHNAEEAAILANSRKQHKPDQDRTGNGRKYGAFTNVARFFDSQNSGREARALSPIKDEERRELVPHAGVVLLQLGR